MRIEYSNYDISSNELEFKDNIISAIKYKPDIVSILPSYTKLVKNILVNDNSPKLSCVIDYPIGSSDLQTRLTSTENVLKNGAQIIELVAPSYFLCNRKYDKFRSDIQEHSELCLKYGAELRYVLEYRIFTYDLLYKVSQILIGHNISKIYPSTGYLLDDISDNILAAALIKKKVFNIQPIVNGNVWNNRHFMLINNNKNNIYGIKVNSIHSLENIYKFDIVK
jgi:deoxyribose-phosphate aldolase